MMSEPGLRKIQEIASAIKGCGRFMIATHARPDGDAIGSLLALTFIIQRLGKIAHPFCEDQVPPGQEFLPGASEIRHGGVDSSLYDAAILVDCGDLQRVGNSLAEPIRKIPFLMNIDHHVNSTPFGDVHWVDPTASSTCEMLYHLCMALRVPLDSAIASQLYTGVIADTGCFRFSNTNQRVLELAAVLVAAGADPARIAREIFDSASPRRLHLLAKVLSTVDFLADQRLATAELTLGMFAETGASPIDSEGFINDLRSVKSVQLAILFREEENGTIHVSLRSKGDTDVAAFAKTHGGGGHHNAAAFRIAGNLAQVRRQITEQAMGIV